MDEKLNMLLKDIRRLYGDARILLFGSRAVGRARTDSDYDLIVISGKFEGVPFQNRAGEIWRNSDAVLAADILCYTPEEFQSAPKNSSILRDALSHAVQV